MQFPDRSPQTVRINETRLEETLHTIETVFLPEHAAIYRAQRAGETMRSRDRSRLRLAGLPGDWISLKRDVFYPARLLLEELFPVPAYTAYESLYRQTEILNAQQCVMLLMVSLSLSPKANCSVIFEPWEKGDTLRVVRRLLLLNSAHLALDPGFGTVYAICGKIAAGKTFYSRFLQGSSGGVPLSMDEMTYKLIDNEQGPFYDSFCTKARAYLLEQSLTYLDHGVNVILDWGFWTKADRAAFREFYRDHGIRSVLHYIDISDADWERNIELRNRTVLEGNGGSAFYVNEGLREKLLRLWEEPEPDEIDLRVPFTRGQTPEI